MSHHSNNPFDLSAAGWDKNFDKSKENLFGDNPQFNLSDALKNQHKNLGATGKFPAGHLNDQDEGEIRFACAIQDDKFIVSFGEKPITWIGFTKDEAKSFAEYILKKIEAIK